MAEITARYVQSIKLVPSLQRTARGSAPNPGVLRDTIASPLAGLFGWTTWEGDVLLAERSSLTWLGSVSPAFSERFESDDARSGSGGGAVFS